MCSGFILFEKLVRNHSNPDIRNHAIPVPGFLLGRTPFYSTRFAREQVKSAFSFPFLVLVFDVFLLLSCCVYNHRCIAKSLNASDTPEFGRRGRLDVRSLPKATKWENQNPFDPKVHFRIDRARWPNALDWTKLGFLNGKHDVHLIRPGYLENWRSKIRPLFRESAPTCLPVCLLSVYSKEADRWFALQEHSART